MTLLSLNVQCLEYSHAFNEVRRVIRACDPNLVFIMETKLFGGLAKTIRESMGFSYGIHIDSLGRSGGIFIMWNNGWVVSVQEFSEDHVDVLIQDRVHSV